MKNYTTTEIKTAKRIAYLHLTSTSAILCFKNFKYDKRTRIGKLSNLFVTTLKKDIDQKRVIEKRKSRIENRKNREFKNILSNPLLKDFLRNSPMQIHRDHLRCAGRNHWAKNSEDIKVLEVLKKYN